MLVQFGNNWMKKIPLTAKLDSAYVQFWLSSEFFSSNYFQIGQHVVLLHILISFLSFRKTSVSSRAKRAREKEKLIFSSSLTNTLLRWRSINPLRFIFYHPGSTDFEEKIEGLWTGYMEVLQPQNLKQDGQTTKCHLSMKVHLMTPSSASTSGNWKNLQFTIVCITEKCFICYPQMATLN